jgi:YidC/Oxa1 family membrane protein insertase
VWDAFLGAFNSILEYLYRLTGSYGLAVIIITVLIRLVLWPLTHSQAVSAMRMQMLQPEIDKLRKKYGKDQQRLGQEMMKLWKQHKINPLSGCLPLLVQLPFLWAVYKVLVTFPHFKGAAFLWIPDLSRPDPWFIIPLLVGASTFWQTYMTSPRGGPSGSQIMLWTMPPFLAWVTATLPAGLGIYWLISNLMSILQYYLVPRARPETESGKASPS